jgi:hypothetical protein
MSLEEKPQHQSHTMNTSLKTLSALTIGGLLAGSAFAGPGDAHPPFAYLQAQNSKATTVALFKSPGAAQCPMATAQSKQVSSGSPRNTAPATVVTGYKHEGCTKGDSSMAGCNSTHHSK